jgi:hypothetical protein
LATKAGSPGLVMMQLSLVLGGQTKNLPPSRHHLICEVESKTNRQFAKRRVQTVTIFFRRVH